ncbi:trans-1,2-dihydrobenzene-1,2-diol dehydrogenase-like isoform X2 [Contarinia nasturtii]|uniref:trans-1,2-dihydrobenzene-1,2-diol dehydrogenase-like isoform X2 n=1 Tax=Contarinia nasturtii TaxID=265458 RepID=UPI0012D37682|nr:trans-1,2-dihydrobenzene-1,2-diol dehydrogenase-like isoform X2 [Contarinia nasturtii]
MALKWGIAAAGKITQDFVNAVNTLNKDDHDLVAVAARDLNRAKEFAKKFGVKKAYGSYLELAQDQDIEVVYVGTLNPQHLEVATLMLENGKHVLVEKPLCLNEKQAHKLITCAKQQNLFLMEAIWSRMFPSYQYVRKQIENGVLGDIQTVEVEFGFASLKNKDRVTKNCLGGGTVLDLGVYAIQCCQWAFKQAPKSINATGTLNDEGVDVDVLVEISYGDNKVGKIKTSALNTLSNTAKIIGTKGQITIPSFWCPTSINDIDGTEKTWPLPNAKFNFNSTNSCGLRYEADEVRKCIRANKKESENVTHNESLLIARIEDEIRKQIGVKFSEDD